MYCSFENLEVYKLSKAFKGDIFKLLDGQPYMLLKDYPKSRGILFI
ncbi:hypothetical protein SAMN04488009_0379 [Maribacter sedimenticola]|uniref:Uncharacterized protein n=1 Tax=Maribacter sedimenticola TaxID=228956 RepID=A0ABY1SCU6_9FLAO|nr:hypothetical protein SAMN04488009_0379 [Maribacter sedimenticola]